jgi:hypothetical protein
VNFANNSTEDRKTFIVLNPLWERCKVLKLNCYLKKDSKKSLDMKRNNILMMILIIDSFRRTTSSFHLDKNISKNNKTFETGIGLKAIIK